MQGASSGKKTRKRARKSRRALHSQTNLNYQKAFEEEERSPMRMTELEIGARLGRDNLEALKDLSLNVSIEYF